MREQSMGLWMLRLRKRKKRQTLTTPPLFLRSKQFCTRLKPAPVKSDIQRTTGIVQSSTVRAYRLRPAPAGTWNRESPTPAPALQRRKTVSVADCDGSEGWMRTLADPGTVRLVST